MAISLLLADDSPTIAKILGMALQNEDYEIRSVLTAEEALRELHAKPPFFFLVDLFLPGKNGFELAELIRGDSKLSKTKVVFLASAFEPVDEEAVKTSGADLVIAKPFDPAELRSSLRQLRDAPPKFPSGAKVQGSLSGQVVAPPDATNTSLTDGGLSAAREVIAGADPGVDDLLQGLPADLDANSILAGLADAPPPPPAGPEPGALELDLGAGADVPPPAPIPPSEPPTPDPGEQSSFGTNPVLDLTGAFTPPIGTQTNLTSPAAAEEPPPFAPPAPAAPSSAPPPPAAGGLSPNAEALAAFFAAEIESKQPAASSPPPFATAAAPEEFEKSLASIEWDRSSPADLDAWSAGPQAAPAAKPAAKAPAPARTDQSAGPASFLFDTGGSSFRFAEDYIHRITRSFTGHPHEGVPDQHAPLFPQQSSDTPPPSPPAAGLGGAWSPVEAEKMERIVREEVQMAVREIVEKVVWEVVPELAENIIKRELDKVMKQLESGS